MSGPCNPIGSFDLYAVNYEYKARLTKHSCCFGGREDDFESNGVEKFSNPGDIFYPSQAGLKARPWANLTPVERNTLRKLDGAGIIATKHAKG